jgi:hypothetical protein
MKILTLLTLFAAAAFGQAAKVIELGIADSMALERAHRDLAAAQTELETVQKHIRQRYLIVPESGREAGSYRFYEDNDLTTSGTLTISSCFALSPDAVVVPSADPCCSSSDSAACFEKKLKKARDKEAAGKKPTPRPIYRYWRAGWEHGFEPTADFRFIVPKPTTDTTDTPPIGLGQGYVINRR